MPPTLARCGVLAALLAAAMMLSAGCAPQAATAPAATQSWTSSPATAAPSLESPSPTPSETTTTTPTPTTTPKAPPKPVAGPAILKKGSTGDKVRELQARLKQIGWWSGGIFPTYGPRTTAAVKGFQGKRRFPVTGEVDQRTWDRIVSMTHKPTKAELTYVVPEPIPGVKGLDPRCMTGRAICASKTTRQVVWVVDGRVVLRFSARFGRSSLPTSNGVFHVYWKSRDHWSTKYDAPMPFALFFNGGQAVHYSPEFASIGYGGVGSHGCVNLRDRSGAESLFDLVRVSDAVVVY
ncbi:MAG TPA: L,D-transpeptidase family protein [Candidatus Lustribacter sp.]|nr:L,D-transpeptidase family protein [Candidatus Lustribacter sp.]